MDLLYVIDNKDYELNWNRFCREAVRAVILNKNKIAMVKSNTNGYYKFPGGGIEQGESHIDTLIRETQEEAGLQIIPESIKEFGMLLEIRKGINDNEIFEQKSYYYYANVTSNISLQNLDSYEYELGYELEYVEISKAYRINMALVKQIEATFLLREAYILNQLLNNL